MNKRVTGNYKVRIQVIRKSFLIDNYVQKSVFSGAKSE